MTEQRAQKRIEEDNSTVELENQRQQRDKIQKKQSAKSFIKGRYVASYTMQRCRKERLG
jgi:hypothetical protein